MPEHVKVRDDAACWKGIWSVAPYFTKYNATRGAGISDESPNEAGTYPYPILITMLQQDAGEVYALTRAIHANYDDYKDSDPGAIGWALEFQVFDWVVPYHEGAVRYWREIGAWSDAFETHNQSLIQRQQVLASAWTEINARRISDKAAFVAAWH